MTCCQRKNRDPCKKGLAQGTALQALPCSRQLARMLRASLAARRSGRDGVLFPNIAGLPGTESGAWPVDKQLKNALVQQCFLEAEEHDIPQSEWKTEDGLLQRINHQFASGADGDGAFRFLAWQRAGSKEIIVDEDGIIAAYAAAASWVVDILR